MPLSSAGTTSSPAVSIAATISSARSSALHLVYTGSLVNDEPLVISWMKSRIVSSFVSTADGEPSDSSGITFASSARLLTVTACVVSDSLSASAPPRNRDQRLPDLGPVLDEVAPRKLLGHGRAEIERRERTVHAAVDRLRFNLAGLEVLTERVPQGCVGPEDGVHGHALGSGGGRVLGGRRFRRTLLHVNTRARGWRLAGVTRESGRAAATRSQTTHRADRLDETRGIAGDGSHFDCLRAMLLRGPSQSNAGAPGPDPAWAPTARRAEGQKPHVSGRPLASFLRWRTGKSVCADPGSLNDVLPPAPQVPAGRPTLSGSHRL